MDTNGSKTAHTITKSSTNPSLSTTIHVTNHSTNLATSISEKQDTDNLLLPFDRFQNWINCVCLVTFDIELGQAIEVAKSPFKCFQLFS